MQLAQRQVLTRGRDVCRRSVRPIRTSNLMSWISKTVSCDFGEATNGAEAPPPSRNTHAVRKLVDNITTVVRIKDNSVSEPTFREA